MSNSLIETIVSDDDRLRNRSIHPMLAGKDVSGLLEIADQLEGFRKSSDNLYHKVRASLFLFVIYRFHLQTNEEISQVGQIPFEGVKVSFDRDFERAIGIFHEAGHNSAVFSALADAYYKLSFKYLLDQVKLSISQCNENYHLYNIKDLDEYPFAVPQEMVIPDNLTGNYPVGVDSSPVRLDPSHSGWSDIFFLGMDFPEGARVVNLSVDLRIYGSNEEMLPPCECYCRYIEEPVLHLTSIDLKASKKINSIDELFNFGNDYLSLLKAGVIASGIIPPCFEYRSIELKSILSRLLGRPGGIEIVTRVNGIPKGSRLAVSTTLLSAIITRLMRFSGQIKNQTGPLEDPERRIVASRAILGEWLGGSGGGWQDSGGIWPGIKLIKGMFAREEHPEYGVSRGCLLPEHEVFSREAVPADVEERIINSMVLVHGGISQDVGPILEMVTEKYLLKYDTEWDARLKGIKLFDRIVDALKKGDMKEMGLLTTEDWELSIQKVIPWVNNAFTEDLIKRAKIEFGQDYWGFLMLGGMAGGGMAFIVNPEMNDLFKIRIGAIMNELKDLYGSSLPFIISPVVYDLCLNHEGIMASIFEGDDAAMPEIDFTAEKTRNSSPSSSDDLDEEEIKEKFGFDLDSHIHIKNLLKKGEIGLAKNRLPLSTRIDDVDNENVTNMAVTGSENYKTGMESLKNGEAAVVTFAGGMGSRWTHGAAVAKPINPFVMINNKYRTFVEIHLAKSRKTGDLAGRKIPHILTTSYLTHDFISNYLESFNHFVCRDQVYLSPSMTIGHRVYPMERDLRFYWQEQLQQKMDDNVQRVLDSVHEALISWTKSRGEGEDYADNNPILRFNPPGHWYEIPNMIKNNALGRLLRENPDLKYLLCHNIDTLGAYLDPVLLGSHINCGSCITFEVTPRRIEDAGGGMARVNGHIQLLEGLALPREEDEYKLSYYNTLTNWINIDLLLEFFALNRDIVMDQDDSPERQKKILDAIHSIEKRIPTYVTIKDVKYLWGSGQEDVYPVAQFEKLWGDMTGLKDLDVSYLSISRFRGMQLKEPSLLDIWMTDGSFDYVKSKCAF